MKKTISSRVDTIKPIKEYEDFDDFLKQTGLTVEQAYEHLVKKYEEEHLLKGR